MSYILDALKKSEVQRQQGRVPDLSTLPANVGAPGSGSAPGRSYGLIAGALAAVLLVAGYLLWREAGKPAVESASAPAPSVAPIQGQGGTQALPQPATPVRTEPAAAVTPGPEAALRSEGRQAAPPPALPRERTAAPARTEAAANAPTPAASTRPQPARPAPAAATSAASDSRPPRTTTPPAVPQAVQAVAPAAAPPPPAPQPAAAQAPAPVTAGAQVREVPPDRVVNYSELPEALRRSLPALTVSGFSHAEESDSRMVLINDRMLREGDDAGGGVRVERIGAEGVILSFKGYRFRPAP